VTCKFLELELTLGDFRSFVLEVPQPQAKWE